MHLIVCLIACLLGGCSREQNSAPSVIAENLQTASNTEVEPPQPEPPSFAGSLKTWSEFDALIRVDITGIILKEEKNLHEWADELEKTDPKTPLDVFTTYLVCQRAGRIETVCKMIPLLFNIIESIPGDRFGYSERLYPSSPLKVMTTYCETFDTIYCPRDNHHPPVSYYLDSFKHSGWTGEELAQWLKERWQNACNRGLNEWERKRPPLPGKLPLNVPSRAALEWQRLYLTQLQRMGKVQTELDRLNNEARESPYDARKWALLHNAFPNAWKHNGKSGSQGAYEFLLDLDWLIPTAEKRPAYEALVMAGSLRGNIHEAFLRRALAVPLTAEECELYRDGFLKTSSGMEQKYNHEQIRAMHRFRVMNELNEFYLRENRNDEAQKIMLEARELRKEHNLPAGDLLAGRTQAASGQRVVEKEILEREDEDETNPTYWTGRASYYQGRQEAQEEEKALRKALELFDTPEARKTDYLRVSSLLRVFLLREKRFQEAAVLFREHRTLVREEPRSLLNLYHFVELEKLLKEYPHRDEQEYYSNIYQMYMEDVKAALEWYKEMPDMPTQDSVAINDYYDRRQLVWFAPELIVREHLLDFENDPFAWEFLNRMNDSRNEIFFGTLLFPPNGRGSLDETALRLCEKVLKEDKLSPMSNYHIGEALYQTRYGRPAYYERAVPFLEEAIQTKVSAHLRGEILSHLATCSLELGDWRKGETYTIESYFQQGSPNLAGNLRRAAELADKADETEEANRIRQRIANLGW